MPKQKIAMLTAGGVAPCLSSAVAELIGHYSELVPDVEMIGYLGGYRGLLKGESVAVGAHSRGFAGFDERRDDRATGSARRHLAAAR